jgi:hypothetical protein
MHNVLIPSDSLRLSTQPAAVFQATTHVARHPSEVFKFQRRVKSIIVARITWLQVVDTDMQTNNAMGAALIDHSHGLHVH